jgi:protein SEY1
VSSSSSHRHSSLPPQTWDHHPITSRAHMRCACVMSCRAAANRSAPFPSFDSSKISQYLQVTDVADAGFNYHLISVFGSQSTGKSTLLNNLFGTDFNVMSESERRQTTKGIWMSKNKKGGMADNILVMDVEGTDGRERGEDQDFERKSALFALATSEVLIVNIWEHQVGLYQGANMGLLKTVFEVNLQLFLKDKTQYVM